MALSIVSTIAILAMVFYLFSGLSEGRLAGISLALLISGGIGNMIDRIALGYVVDFIDFRLINFAVFNGADSFVCVGAGLLVLSLILDIVKENKEKSKWLYDELYYQEGAGHGGQFHLTSSDGITRQIGQFPVFTQNQIPAVQGHDCSTLEAILTIQHPDQTIIGNINSGHLGFGVVDDEIALLAGILLVRLNINVSTFADRLAGSENIVAHQINPKFGCEVIGARIVDKTSQVSIVRSGKGVVEDNALCQCGEAA